MVSERKILEEVTNFYVASTDFNGIAVTQLAKKCKLDLDTLEKHLASLISQDKISPRDKPTRQSCRGYTTRDEKGHFQKSCATRCIFC